MVPITALWLPVLVAAVLVFVVSSVIHMMLTYHRTDFGQMPNEANVQSALRSFGVPPGDYVFPFAGSPEAMKSPAWKEKVKAGPVGFITVFPSGDTGMGKSLTLWFLYSLIVGVFAAYVTGRALGPGALYLEVFRFAGTVAFAGYGLALMQNSIWYKRKWATTLKSMFDALIYSLVTAGAFGWLWPS